MDNPSEQFTDVYDYILQEETDFKTRQVPLASNWYWNMWKHIDMSFQMKNSQFTKGDNDYTRPYNNIIIPIANVNYRTEGFDVKDNELYVDDAENYHLSLLARKFYSQWAIKYSIDTAIDESVESFFDYGIAIAKNVNEERPEIVQPQTIAFCDQTDFMSGPKCFKHNYSVDQLLLMKGKWNSDSIDRAILMSKFKKTVDNKEAKTPGKYTEVYELHGMFPESWLGTEKLGEEWVDTGKYSPQIHIITYYVDEGEKKNGITLFKGKEIKEIFKVIKRDSIFGRACGRGGIEELFHPQIWTNSSEIHMQQMLEATSKVILKTTDKKLKNQKLSNMKHGQILEIDDQKTLDQLIVQPINKVAFDNNVNKWEQVARTIGSASDPQLGLNPTSGTPLGTTEIVTQQGEGIHDYRKGKLSVFWGEIHRDWVFQYLIDEMNKGDQWLDELTLDELQEVAEKVSIKNSNKRIKDLILSGKKVTPQEQETMRQVIKDEFMKGGKQRFMEIMKDEFKDLPLKVKFNIAGKQKDLAGFVNKLNAVFRSIFANPAVLQAPGMSELFNNILESSGLSPIDFSQLTQPQEAPSQTQDPTQTQPVPSPIQRQDLAVKT